MANPEHLKILKQGVEVWNRWREENPAIRPDLREVNLMQLELWGANLANSLLIGSHLGQTTLDRADLRSTHLVGTDLGSAHLYKTDFTGSVFGITRIGDIDLTEAIGISHTAHLGASTVGTDTLERTALGLSTHSSRQPEVEIFLRRAGVRQHLIDYFRSRIGEPIEFYSCFISYSHYDKSFARRLHDQLQARGIRCWLDEHDLKPGDRILDVVNDAIRLHDKILLCCSEASLNSWWVKDEIRKAMERERKEDRDIIIPLMVDRYLLDGWEDGMAADLRSRLAADFTGWEHDNAKFEEQFERVVRALRTDDGAREKAPESSL